MFIEASEQQFFVDARKFFFDIGYVLDMVYDIMNVIVFQRFYGYWLGDSFQVFQNIF